VTGDPFGRHPATRPGVEAASGTAWTGSEAAIGSGMRAIVITEPGGPEVLQPAEVADPVAGPGEVVLEVAATAVNRADLMQRMGQYPPPPGAPQWPGLECSGTVRQVGDGVAGWQVGDRACALLSGGGYAEQVAVPAGQLLPIPAGVSLTEAAALPEVACTVWSNVFMLAGLQPGEVLLVHGGSSGIGTMAIQLARQVGATVAVTAGSAAKLDRCRELGASVLVNYREQDFVQQVRQATDGHGADVILDNMGGAYLGRNVELLATSGRLVVIGLQGGRKAELDLGALLSKRAAVLATTLRARSAAEKATIVGSVREHVWPLVESGAVRPIIHATMPLAEAAAAHRTVEASEHIGKLLLTVT
jgi:putative PIG3 family NAD(P)H quinone oxidoreductase